MASQNYIFKKDNYEVRRLTTDEQLTQLWAAVGVGGPSGGISITAEVNTFNDLPAASAHSGEYYAVLTTTGIIGFRKFAGLYRSNGSSWLYLGNPIGLASDVSNAPAGSITATDVQGAINELDGDITAHVGSRGTAHATATTSEAGFISALDYLKLSGIQAAATANSADSFLLSRANHTGSQASSTITNFNSEVNSLASTLLTAHTAAADPHPGYATPAEVAAAYSPIGHGHVIADITGLQPALDGKLGTGSEAASVNTINGRIVAGANVTLSGAGTALDPYSIAATGGGGGSSPGGSTTQIQFNNAGAFAGDAGFTRDTANQELILGGTNAGITLQGVTAEPPAPSAGRLHLYSKSIAGKLTAKIKGPSGLDAPLQTALWQNAAYLWTPTGATAGVWLNTTGAGAGTYTSGLPTTTNLYTVQKRGRWANVVTTLNQVLGQRSTEAVFFRGAVAGQGGFFFYARAGFDVWTNGGRFFAGLHTGTTVVSADPSALNNTCGFAVDAADNGAISFLTRGTASTKAATGLTITSNKGYDLFMFCAPNSSQIQWRIVDLTTGTEATGTATANLPASTTMATAGVLASNAALTTVTAIQLGVSKIYVETDF